MVKYKGNSKVTLAMDGLVVAWGKFGLSWLEVGDFPLQSRLSMTVPGGVL